MRVIYEDDYGNRTFNGSYIAAPGDIVTIAGEDWVVKTRMYDMDIDELVILITQNPVREKREESDTRLAEVKGAIVEINKRQEAQGKKQRILTEQLVSLRTFLRNQKGN